MCGYDNGIGDALIRYNAKVEGIKWLTVVAKVLLIVYSVQLAAGALFFAAMLLV